MKPLARPLALLVLLTSSASMLAAPLTLSRESNWLIIHGANIPSGQIRINYLEAYCRPNSTDADWMKHTVIRHTSEPATVTSGGTLVRLRDRLEDGVVVDHEIKAADDEIDFRLVAQNPTKKASEAHWAQPCVRLGDFTGFGPAETKDDYAYVPKCFVFIDGKLERMPTGGVGERGPVYAGPGLVPEECPAH